MRIVSGQISDLNWYTESVKEAVRVWLIDMKEKDYLPNSYYISEYAHYLALVEKNLVVSFVAFEKYSVSKFMVINAAWTHECYRRLGLYTRIWNALCDRGRKEKFDYIRSGYNKKNSISAQMQLKQGRRIINESEDFFRTRYDLV